MIEFWRSHGHAFWTQVTMTDDCWEFPINAGHRYGVFRRQRRRIYTHRLAHLLTYGELPAGKLVLHKCDNPPCVRPDHLYFGTHADNADDMRARGRHYKNKWDSCPKGHKYPFGHGPCEPCASARKTAYKQRKKALR